MSVIETATVPLAQQQADALLNVKDLRVTFSTYGRRRHGGQ